MMDKTDTRSFAKKNIIIMIIVLVVVLAVAFAAYFLRISTDSEHRAYRLLKDSADAQLVLIDERVSASFRQMEIIGAEVNWDSNIYDDNRLASEIAQIADASSFENIAISDESGVMLYDNGSRKDCSDRSYFQKALKGETSVEFLKKGRMSGRTVFVFAQPIYKNNEFEGVVVATRGIADISEALETHEAIDGQYKFLCYEDGEIVTTVDGEDSGISSGNINDYFKATNEPATVVDSTVGIYEHNDRKYYGIYTPSGLDDIYIFSAAEKSYVHGLAGLYSKWSFAIIAFALVLVVVISLLIIRQLKRSITVVQAQEAEKNRKLEEYYNFQNRRYLGRKNLSGSFYLNITRNICRKDSKGEIESSVQINEGASIDDLCEQICKRLHPKERARYMECMSRAQMIEAFKKGISTVKNTFLFYYSECGYVWLTIVADIVKNPMTDELEAILYAFSINREKRLEQIGQKLIAEKFEMMGLIDVASRSVYAVKEYSGGVSGTEKIDEATTFVYDGSAEQFLRKILPEQDIREIQEQTRLEAVIAQLDKNDNYSVKLHFIPEGNDKAEYYQISYSYIDDYRECIMISCENVTDVLESKMDAETGLYNMAGFDEKVQKWIADNPGRKYRLQRYKIDGFMNINASYGYKAGSRLINEIGKYMRVRSDSDSFAAHINADNFIRFCAEDSISPEEFYSRFLEDFADYELNYPLSLKMGIYDLCEPDCDILTMSYRADLAIRSIEGDFSKHIAYYSKGLMQSTKEEQQMLADVEAAVKDEQFEVWLQPQFDYRTGRIIGAEALTRWNHPKLGMIMPGAFIPVLERSRQISILDEYVWDKACQYINRWTKKGLNIPVSINVSRVDVQNPEMLDILMNLIGKYDISPESLRLEITESAYMDEPEKLKTVVKTLRTKGFTVEMDDFGSGYSSLNVLKELDIDILKLDMKLVSEIGSGNEKNNNILRTVIQMAKSINMAVVAEGVETKVQADYLSSIDCNYMQGYYFSKPVRAEELEKLLFK